MSNGRDWKSVKKYGQKHGSDGFTLVEVCVVVAIMTVLLSIGFVALIKHQRELKVQEMDNLARAAYMAAENRAVDLARAGTLVKAVGEAGGKVLYGFTYTDKNDTPHNPEAGDSVSILISDKMLDADVLTSPALAYVKMPANDKALIKQGSVDPKISAGHVYLIYDLFSGSVVDAYYAEEEMASASSSWSEFKTLIGAESVAPDVILQKGCTIDSGTVTLAPIPSVSARASAKAFVGRYGTSSSAERNESPDVVGNVTVKINNGDDLYVEIKYPKDSKLDIKVSYKTAEVSFTNDDLTDISEEADISRTAVVNKGKLYLDSYPLRKSTDPDALKKIARFRDLPWLPAIDRVDGGMFTVEVKATQPGFRDGETIAVQGQPLFAEGSTEDTAIVTSLRHLQNLDEGFSGTSGIRSIVQKENIDAKGKITVGADGAITAGADSYEFQAIYNSTAKSYISAQKDGKYCEITDLNIIADDKSTIGTTRYSGLFSVVKDGFNFSNVTVSLLNSQAAGTEDGTAIAGGLAGGTADEGGSVSFSNCVINNAKVNSASERKKAESSASAIAGGLIGSAGKAYFKSCVIGKDNSVAVQATETTTIATPNDNETGFAGGMVGRVTSEFKANGCQLVKANVTSTAAYRAIAGGLAGYSSTKTELISCTIGNVTDGDVQISSTSGSGKPYYFADVWRDGASTLGGAGGMIGYASGVTKLEGCSATGQITIKGSNVSDQAGGLIGICAAPVSMTDETNIKNCTIQKADKTLTVMAGGTEDANIGGNAGGMVGYAIGQLDMSGCTADGIIVKKEKASDYACVGGLVGCVGRVYVDAYSNLIADVFGRDTLTDCSVKGASQVTGNGSTSRIGGLVGAAYNMEFSGCRAENISVQNNAATVGSYSGGIAGYAQDVDFLKCRVYWSSAPDIASKITGYYAGGLAGNLDAANACTISDSFAATFASGYYSGGLLGYASGGSKITIGLSYADNVLGGKLRGGLIGGSECNIDMVNVYAVVSPANWPYPGGSGTDAPVPAGFCGENNSAEFKVANAYANFYGTSTDADDTGTDADITLPKLTYGNSPTLTNCFWVISDDNCYMAKTDGDLDIDTDKIAKSKVKELLDAANGGSTVFINSPETHPYNSSGIYPYPGLTGTVAALPHYGDWGTNSGIIKIKGKSAKEVFQREVRALKKSDGVLADDAKERINKKFETNPAFTYNGKSYRFDRAIEVTLSETDKSRASLLFAAELFEGVISKGFAIMELTCENNGGLRTEASLAMTKSMLETPNLFEAVEKQDDALKKVEDKLKWENISGWSDYSGLFSNNNATDKTKVDFKEVTFETKQDDNTKYVFRFKLTKNADSMEAGMTSDFITIVFPKSVGVLIGAMESRLEWKSAANLASIGAGDNDYTYDTNYATSGLDDLAKEATKYLQDNGYTGYSVGRKDDTAFKTVVKDGVVYAEAEFKLFKDNAEYHYLNSTSPVTVKLKTRYRKAAPSVVMDYLKTLDNKWTLGGSDLYVYAMPPAAGTTSPPTLITTAIPNTTPSATVADQDKKDFENAVKAVLDALGNRGLSGYTLETKTAADTDASFKTLRIEEGEPKADGRKTYCALMDFKVKKTEATAQGEVTSTAYGTLKAKLYQLAGFSADVDWCQTQNRLKTYGVALSTSDKTDRPTEITNIENWAKEQLARMGYATATATVNTIAINTGNANIVDVSIRLVSGSDTKDITVQAPLYTPTTP